MKFKKFYICDNDGKSNCVIRTFTKAFNESYDGVYKELLTISKELNMSFNDIEVFEEYMKRRNTISIDYGKDLKVKDLDLDNGLYIVFCWDKKEIYHMVSIINNTLYDRNNDSMELYVITLYKKV